MTTKRKLIVTLATLGIALNTSSFASDKALIQKLVEKGFLTQEEVQEIQAETPNFAKPKGKSVEKLTISGRLHFQHDYFSGDNNGMDLAAANHFYFRRLRWGAKAELVNGWSGVINLDFTEGGVGVDKAYVGWKYAKNTSFSFGYLKVPFGLEESISSSKIKAVERSAANRLFADDIDFSGRHAGINVKGKYDNGLSYSLSLANSAQGQGSRLQGSTNANNSLGAWGRIQFDTKIDDTKVKFGIDGGYQPENGVVNGDVMAGTAYGLIQFGGFYFQPEIFLSSIDFNAAGAADADTFGYSILAAYKMNSFEPVVRYSYVDTDTFGVDFDELIRRSPAGIDDFGNQNELHSFYLGMNYYIIGNDLKLSMGYEYAEGKGNGSKSEVNGFRTRLQLLF